MTLSAFKLPGDFQIGLQIVNESFRYPDHPEWGFTTGERQNITDQIRAFAKWWPVIRIIQHLSPRIRDSLRGYMWQEGSQPAGLVTIHARGSGKWEIGCLAVLPQYRRRGIARQLMQGALEFIRRREGKLVTLGMVDGNLPAQKLYEQLGFEKYTEEASFIHSSSTPLPSPRNLPEGYTLSPLRFLERWPLYELDCRIIPANIAKYQVVEPARYQYSLPERVIYLLMDRLAGFSTKEMLVYTGKDAVSWGRCQARIYPGGVNYVEIRTDQAHPQAADYLLRHLLSSALGTGKGRDVEFTLAEWQHAENETSQMLMSRKSGVRYVYMGLEL
jgi:ribosomal protein S18 acetylase RimI-like enzyme